MLSGWLLGGKVLGQFDDVLAVLAVFPLQELYHLSSPLLLINSIPVITSLKLQPLTEIGAALLGYGHGWWLQTGLALVWRLIHIDSIVAHHVLLRYL